MGEHRRTDDWFSHILEPAPQDVSLTVQMYGAVLILESALTCVHITHVSENLHDVCGITVEQALHHPFEDICDPSQWSHLIKQAQQKWAAKDDEIYSHGKVKLVSDKEVWMVLHANGPTSVCELLPIVKDHLNDQQFIDSKLDQLRELLSDPTDTIFQTAQRGISFINDILQFDRCVLYRFENAPSFGEVIAESFVQDNPNGLVPFLGLRFPPQQLTDDVTNLYKKLKVRIIGEVFDFISLIISRKNQHSELGSVSPLDLPAGGHADRSLDLLIHSVLRAATADHDEQLVAMGIRNCMTAVLLVNGSLWGAIQCANITVKSYSWSHRLFLAGAAELLSSFISDTLHNSEQQEKRLIDHCCRHIALVNSTKKQCFLIQPLLADRPDLLEMLQGDIGVACVVGQSCFRIGNCGSVEEIKNLTDWMVSPAYEKRPDLCRFAAKRQQQVRDHLRAVRWPQVVAGMMRTVLANDWIEDSQFRMCCWESLPNALLPQLHLTTPGGSMDGMLGVVYCNAGTNHQLVGMFFFRPRADDSEKILQSLSSSILTNSLVSDTVERYNNNTSTQSNSGIRWWSLRQLVIFHLLTSLLRLNIQDRDPWQDIVRLRSTADDSIQLSGRMILNSSQARMVFRKANAVKVQYHCVTVNEEFTVIFGSLIALPPSSNEDSDHLEKQERDSRPGDLIQWFKVIGLDVLTICRDGERVVKQQTIWSRAKGHIKVTLQCRFLYGVQDIHCTESVYCLDIRDDSMSSRVEDALSYAHDQLKKSERMKQELVSTISHELRTPLAAIMGFQEVLHKDLEDRHLINGETQQCLDSISTAAEHLFAIVTDLLDLSKQEMTSSKRSKVDLVTVVHEACRWVALAASRNGININFEILSSPPSNTSRSGSSGSSSQRSLSLDIIENEKTSSVAVTGGGMDEKHLLERSMNVYGDPVGLKRVFVNLLDNAIKFTRPGNVINVAMRWIPSITSEQGGYTNVIVEDHGIGIATENLTNIFRPFYQVDLSSRRKHKGMGLGLSIVRQIVELHKGRISVRSKVGEGTRFDITFPTYDSQTPEQRQRSLKETKTSPLETTQYPVLGKTSVNPPLPPCCPDSDMQQYIPPSHSIMPQAPLGCLRTTASSPRIDSSTCIMIVDDNNVNRRLLHRMLSKIGYSNIVEAENGLEALHTMETLSASQPAGSTKQPVSLMFLDLQMPVMDGPSTAAELRIKGFTFPIIAFSASNYTEEASPTSRFNGFLSKPINSQNLNNILHKHVARSYSDT